MTRLLRLIVRALLIFIVAKTGPTSAVDDGQCVTAPLKDETTDQLVYRIGFLAIRGPESTYNEYNRTADYLTQTAGKQFDPPITFENVPVVFGESQGVIEKYLSGRYDFVYANPSLATCVASEGGLNYLASVISRRKVAGQVYHLTRFGGVLFTQADNDDISSISDIKGKRTACVSLNGLGSGQMQFRELQKAGLHHLQDPKQLIFMKSQGTVVNAVLNGEVDVGYVRTDQLERSIDKRTGEPVDLNLIKIIGAQDDVMIDGEKFPFPISTPLYPEWGFAASPHVSDTVSRAVQTALLQLSQHAAIAPDLLECYEKANCDENLPCQEACFNSLDRSTFENCDTTRELAELSLAAMTNGKYAGFRTSLSYMEIRNMQDEIGFVSFDAETNAARCLRTTELEDAIVCPDGYFKKSADEIATSCEEAGLDCYDFDCLCGPCVEGYDVEFSVVEHVQEQRRLPNSGIPRGCDKFSKCGEVEQRHQVTFQAYDRRKRTNIKFTATISIGEKEEVFNMDPAGSFNDVPRYEMTFDATNFTTGTAIIEVRAGGQQIPESPFRFEIKPRDCEVETGASFREPDEFGFCVCKKDSVEISSTCVPLYVLIPSIIFPMTLLGLIFACWYAEYKRRQADSIWRVKPEELIFEHPRQVLGQGSFGLVLLAEYRGTKVAVKRALPPKKLVEGNKNSRNSRHDNRSIISRTGSSTRSDAPDFPGKQSSSSPPPAPPERRPTRAVSDLEEGMVEDGRTSDSFSEHDSPQSEAFTVGQTSTTASGVRKSYFDPSDKMIFQSGVFDSNELKKIPANELTSNAVLNSRTNQSGSGTGNRYLPWNLFAWKDYAALQSDFIHEMRHLSKLRHPCITTMMGAVVSRINEPMLVLEYMEVGSLYDLLHNESMMLEGDIIIPIVRDISHGLRFLHSAKKPVVHGDLKSKNVLVDAQFRAKVSDFGLLKGGSAGRAATGTPLWMAPELLRGESGNTPASDMYSFGVTLYEIFSRKRPYDGKNLSETLRLIADENVNLRPPVPTSCPGNISTIMRSCFSKDPQHRMTAQTVDEVLKSWKLDSAQRTEELLKELFPENIAKALRDGRKVEPETHDCVTVCFADIVGYTEISSDLPPTKVSNMLDRLYTKFDRLSDLHNVFKVETIGDSYMTVTNLAKTQPDHVSIMAHYAIDALNAATTTLIDEEDPAKGHVQIRIGFHSGPVASHVVGSRNPRYSIIGDTVNIAARLESNSKEGRIHCSWESARLLSAQAPELELVSRGSIKLKGKGVMKTFWVRTSNVIDSSFSYNIEDVQDSDVGYVLGASPLVQVEKAANKRERLIETNVNILRKYLERIVAARQATEATGDSDKFDIVDEGLLETVHQGKSPFGEVTVIIELPEFNHRVAKIIKSSGAIELSDDVLSQLRNFVNTISGMYPDNAFHSFEHATHVTQSIDKLLESVVAPRELDEVDDRRRSQTVHEYTYGISSDPLTQFAVVFSALIHDVDHPGVPNAQLVKEGSMLASMYDSISVAEQNSIELSWHLLMEDRYKDVRAAIYQSNDDMLRFRQLVVNTVLATDIVDKELKKLRNLRWEQAFDESDTIIESYRNQVNRKATIVIEHLIQASDVAHTMQQWHVYRKWNEMFFDECYGAYVEGRAAVDPSINWYKGELGFFDFYIIPLTRKLKDCGVFGYSSSEYLNCAIRNRDEWKVRGEKVVEEMKNRVEKKIKRKQSRVPQPREVI